METTATTKKTRERRSYHNDAESTRREIARWEILYPWYGRLVEDIRSQLRERDQRHAAVDALY